MPIAHARRPALVHPPVGDLTLVRVLHALADPARLTIVRTLRRDPERACGTFPVDVAPSTLTHRFRILREAGVIKQRETAADAGPPSGEPTSSSASPASLDTVMSIDDARAAPASHHRRD
jgi:hypothetical protein